MSGRHSPGEHGSCRRPGLQLHSAGSVSSARTALTQHRSSHLQPGHAACSKNPPARHAHNPEPRACLRHSRHTLVTRTQHACASVLPASARLSLPTPIYTPHLCPPSGQHTSTRYTKPRSSTSPETRHRCNHTRRNHTALRRPHLCTAQHCKPVLAACPAPPAHQHHGG